MNRFIRQLVVLALTLSSVVATSGATVPHIDWISPPVAVQGSPGFSLIVNGSGFTSTSVVRWNGSDRPTTFISSTELQAEISADDLAVVGDASVTVFTYQGGHVSGKVQGKVRI